MGYQIISPPKSFVQFGESDTIFSCELAPLNLCLPVYNDDDVTFQFVVRADTDSEADDLCSLTNTDVILGVVKTEGPFLLSFDNRPERFRIGGRDVLFNWEHGLPDFKTVIAVGNCFKIAIVIFGDFAFYSNCFQRIGDDCHTSVVEYTNDDNFAGFNYCNGVAVNPEDGVCESTFIEFGPVEDLTLTYTASLQEKYGNFPTVDVWGYIGSELVKMTSGIEIKANGYPPTSIHFDFGGELQGIIKIRK